MSVLKLISSLPGKALRILVAIARLAGNIWYSIYQFIHCCTLITSDFDVIFDCCVSSASLVTSFKECNVIMT